MRPIYKVKSVEKQIIKPEKHHCVLQHYLRTNKSLSTKPFPINHLARNWQEQNLTTVWQFVPKCDSSIYSIHLWSRTGKGCGTGGTKNFKNASLSMKIFLYFLCCFQYWNGYKLNHAYTNFTFISQTFWDFWCWSATCRQRPFPLFWAWNWTRLAMTQ